MFYSTTDQWIFLIRIKLNIKYLKKKWVIQTTESSFRILDIYKLIKKQIVLEYSDSQQQNI